VEQLFQSKWDAAMAAMAATARGYSTQGSAQGSGQGSQASQGYTDQPYRPRNTQTR
ncbi:hypothetical protein A2U01_0110372, partial [Trifolium medium]|nr:hypothetical protein [Trifolium medium]